MRKLKVDRGSALRAGAGALVLLATAAVSGCGSAVKETAVQAVKETAVQAVKETAGQAAQLQTTCAKDAKPVGLPFDFPASAKLPQGYFVDAVDKRDAGRTVVSAVSPKPFRQTLKDMQATYSANGWKLSEGEVEEADAESNFSGNGIIGRWAIRSITACEGNTGVSLVTAKAGS
jgi:uncharacterized protein YceK